MTRIRSWRGATIAHIEQRYRMSDPAVVAAAVAVIKRLPPAPRPDVSGEHDGHIEFAWTNGGGFAVLTVLRFDMRFDATVFGLLEVHERFAHRRLPVEMPRISAIIRTHFMPSGMVLPP